MDLFAREKINIGRQKELDIAKGFSILFMIFIHTIIIAMLFENTVSWVSIVLFDDILGGPSAAPVFMFCMGIGMVYTRSKEPEKMIRRGISLLLIGFIVNIGEFILPHFLSGYLLNDPTLFPFYGGLILFYVDILGFAGQTFILMGILKKFNVSNKQLLIFAIFLSIIGSLVRYTIFDSTILNFLFGYFIGTYEAFTTFPLFNWFIFPAAGYVYGQYFIRCKDKSQFFKFWPVCIIIPLMYFIYTLFTPGGYLYGDATYYFLNTVDAIFTIIYIHGFIGFNYLLSLKLPERLTNFFIVLSKHINMIYIAQWYYIPITIILIVYLIKGNVFTDLSVFLIAIFIIAISTLSAIGYKNLKSKIKSAG